MVSINEPDWSTICLDLRRHYKGLSAIALDINSTGQHLTRLSRGDVKEPSKWSVGDKLLRLHKMYCEK